MRWSTSGRLRSQMTSIFSSTKMTSPLSASPTSLALLRAAISSTVSTARPSWRRSTVSARRGTRPRPGWISATISSFSASCGIWRTAVFLSPRRSVSSIWPASRRCSTACTNHRSNDFPFWICSRSTAHFVISALCISRAPLILAPSQTRCRFSMATTSLSDVFPSPSVTTSSGGSHNSSILPSPASSVQSASSATSGPTSTRAPRTASPSSSAPNGTRFSLRRPGRRRVWTSACSRLLPSSFSSCSCNSLTCATCTFSSGRTTRARSAHTKRGARRTSASSFVHAARLPSRQVYASPPASSTSLPLRRPENN
ncbi:hypothetical protein C8R47DRAFT_1125869 [Mycena vitilis]|nr:hypothetical protein C8R47DRAFT_1125869 [Mycena vitilis]